MVDEGAISNVNLYRFRLENYIYISTAPRLTLSLSFSIRFFLCKFDRLFSLSAIPIYPFRCRCFICQDDDRVVSFDFLRRVVCFFPFFFWVGRWIVFGFHSVGLNPPPLQTSSFPPTSNHKWNTMEQNRGKNKIKRDAVPMFIHSFVSVRDGESFKWFFCCFFLVVFMLYSHCCFVSFFRFQFRRTRTRCTGVASSNYRLSIVNITWSG